MKKYLLLLLMVGLLLPQISCMNNKEIERIKVKQFGVLDDGRTVQVYTLQNKLGTTIDILDLGGIIASINVADRNGNFSDIALGFDNPQQYLTDSPYMGALVGRYANRIAKGKFTLDSEEYSLPVNNGKNALHGGIIGFDKQVWKSTPTTLGNEAQLELSLISHDGEEGYPGELSVTVTYRFDDQNRLTITYKASTDKATVINLTNHAYFNLNGHNAGSILDHEMMINASYYTPVDETLIPTGEIVTTSDTPMDFQASKPIGRDINDANQQLEFGMGYDHNWVLNKSNEQKIELAATAYSPQSGNTLKVYTDQPGIQFYTGNFLDGSFQGKDNTFYQQQNAFCLESQHFPDSPNQPNFPSTVLRPGELYKTTTIFEFDIKK